MERHVGNYQDAKNSTGDYAPVDASKERVAVGRRRPTGIHANLSAIPWEIFRIDGEPLTLEDFKNGYFVDENDLVPNPE